MSAIDEQIKILETEVDDLYNQYRRKREKVKDLEYKKLGLDFLMGKYIKYTDVFDWTHYVKIDEIGKIPTDEDVYKYYFRGLGFSGEFTEYDDSTSFDWSKWYEFEINKHTFKEFSTEIDKIEIITEVDFNNMLEEYLHNVITYHFNKNTNNE